MDGRTTNPAPASTAVRTSVRRVNMIPPRMNEKSAANLVVRILGNPSRTGNHDIITLSSTSVGCPIFATQCNVLPVRTYMYPVLTSTTLDHACETTCSSVFCSWSSEQ